MSNYNIEEMARGMGFNDTYLNKLRASNQYITESANQDRNKINAQLNQTLADYERERSDQNQKFIKDAQGAYVDYAKAINPYSSQRSQANRIGLGNSGYSESSLIGANNAYQNRYTETKTNYDNIFANINNNIAKARETSNIELAKIAQNEQDRLLENLYKINDLYTAEKEREEEKRRWEAEMALQRQAAARSSSSGSRRYSNKNSPVVAVDSGNNQQSNTSNNVNLSTQAKALLTMGQKSVSLGNKNSARSAVVNAFSRGQISEGEAQYISNKLGI